MSKIDGFFRGISQFCGEVSSELRKCAWPTWNELFDSTVALIVSVFLLAAVVALCDIVLRQAVRFVLSV